MPSEIGTISPSAQPGGKNHLNHGGMMVPLPFAYKDGAGGGWLVLDLLSFQSVGSFNNDIAELHSQEHSVLLSIGGSSDMGVHLTTSPHVTEILQPE